MNLAESRRLSATVWFLIVGTMLSKASYFLSMPYLALRMKTTLGLDPVAIGFTLGLGPLVGLVAGFYLGYLSDHWGRKQIFELSMLVWSFTFVGFGLATELWQFALLTKECVGKASKSASFVLTRRRKGC